MSTVQIYNTRTDVWTQKADHTVSRYLSNVYFFQYGSELIYWDRYGAVEYKVDSDTWVENWPDGVPVALDYYATGRAVVYQ